MGQWAVAESKVIKLKNINIAVIAAEVESTKDKIPRIDRNILFNNRRWQINYCYAELGDSKA